MQIFDRLWWKATGSRAFRTFLSALAGTLMVSGGFATYNWGLGLSTAALTTLLAVATAMLNLPEVDPNAAAVPKWKAVLMRTLKQAGQTFVALIPSTAVFLNDVNWTVIAQVVGASALATALYAVASILPETASDSIEIIEETE